MKPARSAIALVLAAALWPAAARADDPATPGNDGDTAARELPLGPVDVSIFGETTYRSSYYTAAADPGSGVEGYANLHLSAWPWNAGGGRFQIYADLVPAVATTGEFFWRRYGQLDVGVQWLPFVGRDGVPGPAQGLRLFAQAVGRRYYDQPAGSDPSNLDLWLGADYYYDDLQSRRRFGFSTYSSLTWRGSNFLADDYDALIWEGNLDLGPKLELARGLVMVNGVLEWAWAPQRPELWWDNYLRVGLGLRWFPATRAVTGWNARQLFLRYLQLFVEAVENVAWLGDDPGIDLEETDVRFGVAFATGGKWGRRPTR